MPAMMYKDIGKLVAGPYFKVGEGKLRWDIVVEEAKKRCGLVNELAI